MEKIVVAGYISAVYLSWELSSWGNKARKISNHFITVNFTATKHLPIYILSPFFYFFQPIPLPAYSTFGILAHVYITMASDIKCLQESLIF
jgi:hypothetical protein